MMSAATATVTEESPTKKKHRSHRRESMVSTSWPYEALAQE